MSEEQLAPQFDWRRPQTFWTVAVAAATTPRAFFAEMPRTAGFMGPLSFFLATMLLPTLVRTLAKWSDGPGVMLTLFSTSLLISLVMVLVFTFVLYCVCRFMFKTTLEPTDFAAIVCYSSGVRVLEFLPSWLSPMAGLILVFAMVFYIVRLVWVGLQAAGGLSRAKAVVALGVAFLAMVLLWHLINILRGQPPLPGAPASGAAPPRTHQALGPGTPALHP